MKNEKSSSRALEKWPTLNEMGIHVLPIRFINCFDCPSPKLFMNAKKYRNIDICIQFHDT